MEITREENAGEFFCANWNGAARVWGNNERVQGGGIFGHWKDKKLGVREISPQ